MSSSQRQLFVILNICFNVIIRKCRAVFVSVGYRLAPENRWPAPAEDCLAVTNWVLKHKDQIG